MKNRIYSARVCLYDDQMTTVIFMRHGPTQENHEQRIQGHQPGTLIIQETESYLSAVVPLLREKSPTVLVSSDLERAVKTADILESFLQIPNLKRAFDPLLREKAMGFYEGMLWKDVPPEFQAQRRAMSFDFRKFGGENDEDVRLRVVSVLRRFAQEFPNQKICCVTHAGWIRQLVGMADKVGVLEDGWTKREAIYEAGLGPIGQMQYFHPINLTAVLPEGD